MIENHGTTIFGPSGNVSVNGLIASNYKTQDEAVHAHLSWVITELQKTLSYGDTSSATCECASF